MSEAAAIAAMLAVPANRTNLAKTASRALETSTLHARFTPGAEPAKDRCVGEPSGAVGTSRARGELDARTLAGAPVRTTAILLILEPLSFYERLFDNPRSLVADNQTFVLICESPTGNLPC